MDMGAFSKAFTSSFEATLNELIAMGFQVEVFKARHFSHCTAEAYHQEALTHLWSIQKVEWNEGEGHKSYAILSINY